MLAIIIQFDIVIIVKHIEKYLLVYLYSGTVFRMKNSHWMCEWIVDKYIMWNIDGKNVDLAFWGL